MATVQTRTDILDLLVNQAAAHAIGSVGSPSNTTEIIIDILQTSEDKKVLGQLVYLVVPQDDKQLAVIGQISKVETKNRWHEDLTFRGIIKRRGRLPHLSERADVRTATISVQACFAITPGSQSPDEVTESILGISPSTGLTIYRVRDEVLDALLQKYADQIIYLGHVYGTQVKMPFWLKHFGDGAGGAGEAYHVGVFGKTGSGKSGLAAYLLLGYARHHNMGIIFIDPQGQFSTNTDLPFDLHGALRLLGRQVEVYRLSTQVRLPDSTPLFSRLLAKTRFYRSIGVGHSENREQAIQELRAIVNSVLNQHGTRLDTPPPDSLREALQALVSDPQAIQRIYLTQQPRQRFVNTINGILTNQMEFDGLLKECWQPVLDLFMQTDSRSNQRTALNSIIARVIGSGEGASRPIVFLDISGRGTTFAGDEEVIAIFLNQIGQALTWQGEKAFQQGGRLNCLVALDEAHRFARARGSYDTSEMALLSQSFVDAVRTTRKFGLGYMFITLTLASLHPEIVQQLRLNGFGFGLTLGSEYNKLEELVGDKQALSLYRSFVDPQSSRQFPFMFTGPASPLSFTGAPLFVQVFTRFEDFRNTNPWVGTQSQSTPPILPRRQVRL
jgi:hypothetical protein